VATPQWRPLKKKKKVKTVQSVLYIISCTLVNRTTLLGQKIENTEKMMKPHGKPHGNLMKPQKLKLTCTLFRFLTPAQHHHTKRGQGTRPGRATLRDFAFTKHRVGGGTRAT